MVGDRKGIHLMSRKSIGNSKSPFASPFFGYTPEIIKRREDRFRKIIELRDQRVTHREIGELYGVSAGRARQLACIARRLQQRGKL
jgi:hypothetical protein